MSAEAAALWLIVLLMFALGAQLNRFEKHLKQIEASLRWQARMVEELRNDNTGKVRKHEPQAVRIVRRRKKQQPDPALDTEA